MTGAATLTSELGGRWYGSYGLAFCPAHENTRTPALSLGDGREGQLLARCHAGCRFAEIVGALRGLGLLDEGKGSLLSGFGPGTRAFARVVDARKRADQARRLWQEAEPIAGTPAEAYLRRRGITCHVSGKLRYQPDCWHQSARWLPAMVAFVEGADGFAVHRTYLRRNGCGKAEVIPAKAMLGRCAGGAVRLSEAPGPLVVAEGIETALSLLSGLLRGPATVWAALSTSGMKALRLPPEPGQLIVAPDGDPPGRAAAHSLAERASALGWRVSLLPAPDNRDWNDILLGRAAA